MCAAPKGHLPYSGSETGGRPVIYTEEFINNEADELEVWLDDPENKSLFLREFAYKRKYSYNRLQEFAKINEKFSGMLDRAKEWQVIKLSTGALTRDFDSGFTKFLMPRVCGPEWRETKDITVTTNGPVPEWIVDAEGKSKNLIDD